MVATKQKTDKERLNAIFAIMQKDAQLSELLRDIEGEMLALVHAERMTVYQKSRKDQEIVSRYQSEDEEVHEIRLPLTMSSIAGYAAMCRKTVRIDDVYDNSSLLAIHPNLRFDNRFDQLSGFRTRAMLVIPIQFGDILLGLLQAINRVGGGGFTDQDVTHAKELTRVIAHKLRFEFECTRSPFDYLIQQGKASLEQVAEIQHMAAASRFSAPKLLARESGLTHEEIGESLERYYQVPFMSYQPGLRLPTALLQGLKSSYFKRQAWIPVRSSSDKAVVLMEDPSDIPSLMDIQNFLRAQHYEFRVGFKEDILRYLEESTRVDASSPPAIPGPTDNGVAADKITLEATLEALSAPGEGEGEGKPQTGQRWINRLLVTALRAGVEEIRIDYSDYRLPGMAKLNLGDMVSSSVTIPPELTEEVCKRIKIMGQMDPDETKRLQSGRCKLKSGGRLLALQIVISPTDPGENIILRISDAG